MTIEDVAATPGAEAAAQSEEMPGEVNIAGCDAGFSGDGNILVRTLAQID